MAHKDPNDPRRKESRRRSYYRYRETYIFRSKLRRAAKNPNYKPRTTPPAPVTVPDRRPRQEKTYHERQAEKRLWLNTFKTTNPCTDCHQFFPACCMDFDHLPEFPKLSEVAALMSRSAPIAMLQEEASKCELVCSNCHRLRTDIRRKAKKAVANTLEIPHAA